MEKGPEGQDFGHWGVSYTNKVYPRISVLRSPSEFYTSFLRRTSCLPVTPKGET